MEANKETLWACLRNRTLFVTTYLLFAWAFLAACSCTSIGSDEESETRTRFAKANVAYGEICESEQQTRQCKEEGCEDWSGTYTYETCVVLSPAQCDDFPNQTQQSRTRYETATVPFGESCESEVQTRTCEDGLWSGWTGIFTFENCVADAGPESCGSTPSGGQESRVRYETDSVQTGESCESETQSRTCEDGVWSNWTGTFVYNSCLEEHPDVQWPTPSGTPIQSGITGTAHNNQGPRKIARIGNTVIVTGAEGGSDGIYKSTDNGGSWSKIGTVSGGNRGTIITGPNQKFFAFWIKSSGIFMARFGENESPSASSIYAGNTESVGSAFGYHQVSATIDEQGNLYLVAHYKGGTNYDRIWFLKSTDGGETWTAPTPIYDSGNSVYYPHAIVDHNNHILVSFGNPTESLAGGLPHGERRVYMLKSIDQGVSWQPPVDMLSSSSNGGSYANPMIIESKANNLFLFAQCGEPSMRGLVYSKSVDGGNTWSEFSLIQKTNDIKGYGDPSAAIGFDGSIYVTFRTAKSENGSDYSCDGGTICWQNAVVRSVNEGSSWNRVDTNTGANYRTGPANSFRYQNWWNNGGPIEWTWEQYLSSKHPVYYDINTAGTIYDRMASGNP